MVSGETSAGRAKQKHRAQFGRTNTAMRRDRAAATDEWMNEWCGDGGDVSTLANEFLGLVRHCAVCAPLPVSPFALPLLLFISVFRLINPNRDKSRKCENSKKNVSLFVVRATCAIVISACPLFIISTWCFHEYIHFRKILWRCCCCCRFFLLFFGCHRQHPLHRCIAHLHWNAEFLSSANLYLYKSQWNKFLKSLRETPENTSSTGCHLVRKNLVAISRTPTHSYGTGGPARRMLWILTNIYCHFSPMWSVMIVFHLMSTYVKCGWFCPLLHETLTIVLTMNGEWGAPLTKTKMFAFHERTHCLWVAKARAFTEKERKKNNPTIRFSLRNFRVPFFLSYSGN